MLYKYSGKGATKCSAPANLHLDKHDMVYDLRQIQNLVLPFDAPIRSETKDLLENDLFNTTDTISVSDTSDYVFGIFRPTYPTLNIGKQMTRSSALPELINGSYVMRLRLKNPREAGQTFPSVAQPYGDVRCEVPSRLSLENIGDSIERIVGKPGGAGVTVVYRGGDICDAETGVRYNTTIAFLCDLNGGKHPEEIERDGCSTLIQWRTAAACPICHASFYSYVFSLLFELYLNINI